MNKQNQNDEAKFLPNDISQISLLKYLFTLYVYTIFCPKSQSLDASIVLYKP